MKREMIMKTIELLAISRGYYQRLYNKLCYCKDNKPSEYNCFMQHLENQNLNNVADLIVCIGVIDSYY